MKFLTDFTYRNLHGFARFPGDSTALVFDVGGTWQWVNLVKKKTRNPIHQRYMCPFISPSFNSLNPKSPKVSWLRLGLLIYFNFENIDIVSISKSDTGPSLQ